MAAVQGVPASFLILVPTITPLPIRINLTRSKLPSSNQTLFFSKIAACCIGAPCITLQFSKMAKFRIKGASINAKLYFIAMTSGVIQGFEEFGIRVGEVFSSGLYV
jgi:hypothetical protein